MKMIFLNLNFYRGLRNYSTTSLFIVVFLSYLILSIGVLPRLIICIEENGKIALEPRLMDYCCSNLPASSPLFPIANFISDHLEKHCGDCTDLPLTLDSPNRELLPVKFTFLTPPREKLTLPLLLYRFFTHHKSLLSNASRVGNQDLNLPLYNPTFTTILLL